jgi:hypothetical protein
MGEGLAGGPGKALPGQCLGQIIFLQFHISGIFKTAFIE